MAVDMFLKLDGIPGESTDKGHPGAIEISSFSWGMSNAGAAAAGGGGAGKVSFQDFHFTKRIDKASPLLAKSCATGEHIKSAVLSVRKAGGEQQLQDYIKYELEDVLVTSLDESGDSGDDAPTDECSLNFAKITFSYAMQNADGRYEWVSSFSWDLKQNKGA